MVEMVETCWNVEFRSNLWDDFGRICGMGWNMIDLSDGIYTQ